MAGKSRKKRKTNVGDRITRGACGIMTLCLGILMFACLFVASDAVVIQTLRAIIQGIAGALCPLIPIIVCWGGILLTFSAQGRVSPRRIVCFVALFVCVASIFQLYQINDVLRYMQYNQLSENYFEFIRLSYIRSSAIKTGGGVLGALLAWPMWRALDLWGSMLLFIFVILADLMLITGISLYQVSDYVQALFGDVRQNLSERREERRAAREAALEQQAQEEPVRPASTSRVLREEERPQKARRTRARRPQRQEEEDPYVAPEEPAYEQPEAWDETAYAQDAYAADAQDAYAYRGYQQDEPLPFRYDEYGAYGDVTAHQTAYEEAPQLYIETIEPTTPTRAQESKVLDLPEFMLRKRGRRAQTAQDGQPDAAGAQPVEDAGDASAPWDAVQADATPQPASWTEPETAEEPAPWTAPEAAEEPAPWSEPAVQRGSVPQTEPVSQIAPVPQTPSAAQPESTQRPEPSRRLDDTPITLPQKKENPLAKPVEPYCFPPIDLLKNGKPPATGDMRKKDEEGAAKLVGTLKSFGVQAKVLNVTHGPAITRYELQPAPGVKVSRILSLVDDIALNMASAGVRIEAPIPGKPAVGIEIPNESIATVALRDVLESDEARRHPSPLACALGKDIAGRNIVADLAKMPHVLIAGATGSGKSVCINTIINSVIFRATPEQVRLILIDPKVVELSVYNGIPHLLVPVVTDPKKASGALSWAVMEMDHRYKRFAGLGVRDIRGYNAAIGPEEERMPQIVVIIDELADLMMVAPGEVEESICRLAQLARAAGIHLVIATQRPSVNVITGVIKANIPSRIAFAVSSQVDSRTILDSAGAEKLLGKGDMLFAPQGTNKPLRVQGCFVSDEEVARVVAYVKQRFEAEYNEDVIEHLNSAESAQDEAHEETEEVVDELLEQAIELAVESGQASISMLQRRLRVGYARAGRLIDEMARRGIVAQAEGAKPRAVLMTREELRKLKE